MGTNFISPNAQILPQKSWWETLKEQIAADPQRGTPGHIPEFQDTFVGQLGRKLGLNQNDLQGVQMLTGILGNSFGSPVGPRSDPGSMGMGMSLKNPKNLDLLSQKLLETIKRVGVSERFGRTPITWGTQQNAQVAKEFLETKYPDITKKLPITLQPPSMEDLIASAMGSANLGYFRPTVLSQEGVPVPNPQPRAVVIKNTPMLESLPGDIGRPIAVGAHELTHGLINQNITRNTKFPIIGQSGGRDQWDYVTGGRRSNEMPLEELFYKTPTFDPGNLENVAAHKGLHDFFRYKAYLQQPEEVTAFRGGKTGENAYNKVIQHIHDQKVKDYKVLDLTAPLKDYSSTHAFLSKNNLLSDSDRNWIAHTVKRNPNATFSNVISPTMLRLKLKEAGLDNVRIKGRFRAEDNPTIEDVNTPAETLWKVVTEQFEAENPGMKGKFPKK